MLDGLLAGRLRERAYPRSFLQRGSNERSTGALPGKGLCPRKRRRDRTEGFLPRDRKAEIPDPVVRGKTAAAERNHELPRRCGDGRRGAGQGCREALPEL